MSQALSRRRVKLPIRARGATRQRASTHRVSGTVCSVTYVCSTHATNGAIFQRVPARCSLCRHDMAPARGSGCIERASSARGARLFCSMKQSMRRQGPVLPAAFYARAPTLALLPSGVPVAHLNRRRPQSSLVKAFQQAGTWFR